MDIENRFNIILQSVLSGDNEANQQAIESYNDMIINSPEELVLAHFQSLSTAKSDQERTLTLILIGRYFSFLQSNNIALSEDTSALIQIMFFSIYQLDNFTPLDYRILSHDIIIALYYFGKKWDQLPDSLYELLSSSNKLILSSAANCLSYIIFYQIYDFEKYFDTTFEFVKNELSTIDDTDLQYLSSILQLFYSLAKFHQYQPVEAYIPIFREIPKYLRLSKNDNTIFNDFHSYVKFDILVFGSLIQDYFDMYIEILSNPEYSNVKSVCIISFSRFIQSNR